MATVAGDRRNRARAGVVIAGETELNPGTVRATNLYDTRVVDDSTVLQSGDSFVGQINPETGSAYQIGDTLLFKNSYTKR